ncbi:hypothetical protein [Nocardia niigatensis]|uniref:hypothetical protein n=1 Tax=Nocardia niigatensis TaxID=209249 RepID=UPI0005939F91|nr:hypothetical protein [Nocardia niigatensis]
MSAEDSLARRAACQPSSPGDSKDEATWDRSAFGSESHADIISAKIGVPPMIGSAPDSAGCKRVWKNEAAFCGFDRKL